VGLIKTHARTLGCFVLRCDFSVVAASPTRRVRAVWGSVVLFPLFILAPSLLKAQENTEIQVYGSDLVEVGHTMVELHSNFTFTGRKQIENGVLPTHHAFHETLEITHGFTPWFEIGFYVFTNARAGDGFRWVGDHIRPRLKAPESWHWPVGVSLSQEIGYQRRWFSEATWSWEIRPIVDKEFGKLYVTVNPVLGRDLKGGAAAEGFEFSPNVAVTYELTPKIIPGVEYYGSFGPLRAFLPGAEQGHQIFPALNLNVSPEWEINMGLGIGLSKSTDPLLFKLILGRRF
jgi:hypothetical protein